MGVGSEVYGAVSLGRRGIGIELKKPYFNQAIKNMEIAVEDTRKPDQGDLLDDIDLESIEDSVAFVADDAMTQGEKP
jgi:hypothetical protein